MKLSLLIRICMISSFIYITLGDAFLPQPYGNNSRELRNNINEYIIGFFPTKKLENFQKTLPAMENVEKATSGSTNSPL